MKDASHTVAFPLALQYARHEGQLELTLADSPLPDACSLELLGESCAQIRSNTHTLVTAKENALE